MVLRDRGREFAENRSRESDLLAEFLEGTYALRFSAMKIK
jgi:hypothetical protein